MKAKLLLAISGVILFVIGALLLVFGAHYTDWEVRYKKTCDVNPPPHLQLYSITAGSILLLMGSVFIIWGWGHHLGHTMGTILHVK